MKNPKLKLIEGSALLIALTATEKPVKIVSAGADTRRVSSALALNLARSGRYHGYGSATRVRNIRMVEDTLVPAPIRDDSYRYGRAVLRYHGAPQELDCYTTTRNPAVASRIEAIRREEYRRSVHRLPNGETA